MVYQRVFTATTPRAREIGAGTWYNCNGEYPISQPGDLLGTLNIEDPKHPKFTATVLKREASLETGLAEELGL